MFPPDKVTENWPRSWIAANPIEMNLPWPEAMQKLNAHPDYPALFFNAFGTHNIDSILVAKAIAQFERTMISSNSKWDRYLRNEVSLTQAESQGFEIFFSEIGDCFHCHTTITGWMQHSQI